MEELKYFFSYVRMDSEFVLKLAKELRAVGANVWLDQLDILGGQHWDSTVEKALKSCKGMIAVLSPESVASKNVMDEVSYALDEGKLVVPVIIRSCNIPYRLRRVQYIDFTADYDTGFSQLLRALGIEQPVQPLESTAGQEPSLPERPESAVGEQKEAEVRSKRQKTKVLAAICIVMLIAIVSIVVFLKYFKTYNLTATAGAGGSISPTATTPVTYGGERVFTATPDEGYQIDTWSIDEKPVPEEGRTFALSNIRSNHTVNVTFRRLEYEVTGTAGAGGSISPSGVVRVNSGADQSFTITPKDGYQIDDVLVDGNSVGAEPSYIFKNVTANHTIAASFALRARTGDVVTNSIGMKLVYIPAGLFMMGSSDSAAQLAGDYKANESDFANEFPQHQVRISKGFWMGQTEVTQGQYMSVMNEQPWLRQNVQKHVDCPAGLVNWHKAVEFCRKLSKLEGKTYRLPSEAEWEYACRAGTTTRFSFGDSDSSLGDYAWFSRNANDSPRMIGHKKPNPWGLYDMHGNVTEWCSDWYDKDYYSNSPNVDPNGPTPGAERCCRGGSFYSRVSNELRSSFRTRQKPYGEYRGLGFRVVRSQ